jgi:NitT/TauT family transport system permease protein
MAIVLLAWEALARAGLLSVILFPAPTVVFAFLRKSATNGELGAATGATLGRIGAGFVLGAAPGVLLGWAMGWSRRLRGVMDPIIAALHPIPKVAIFPLFMFIFGIGELSKVVAIAVSTLFPLLINAVAGVRQINPVYLEVARNYGASRWNTLSNVIIPGSLPLVLAGVRIAVNTALVIAIAVEFVSGQVGLGVMILFAWQTLRIEELYAALFVIAVLGLGFNLLLEWMSHLLAPWHYHSSPDEAS